MVTVLELLTFGERLKELFGLERRQGSKDLIHACHYLKGGVRGWTGLCSVVSSSETRGNRQKHTQLHLYTRKNLCIVQ